MWCCSCPRGTLLYSTHLCGWKDFPDISMKIKYSSFFWYIVWLIMISSYCFYLLLIRMTISPITTSIKLCWNMYRANFGCKSIIKIIFMECYPCYIPSYKFYKFIEISFCFHIFMKIRFTLICSSTFENR